MKKSNNGFYTKDNIQMIMNIFVDYMYDKYNFLIRDKESVNELKQNIFNVMTSVAESANGTESLQRLNSAVLANIKEMYVKKMETAAQRKPNIKSLERERDVFGNREVPVNNLLPERDPYTRKSATDIDKVISDRDELFPKKTPPKVSVSEQLKEIADNNDDFMRKYKALEKQRESLLPSQYQADDGFMSSRIKDDSDAINKSTANNLIDIKQLYKTPQKASGRPQQQLAMSEPNQHNHDVNDIMTSRQNLIIPRTCNQILIQKYISVNSFDRNWTNNVMRYSYSVNFKGNDINTIYKNINSIEIGKVIIPEEIVQNVQTGDMPRTMFNHEFSLSYPYVILKIDEFNDVYDGTNNNIRKGFCKLIYNRSYRAPNGRGYIVMKPMQKERKVFHPTPLSSLNRMSISLLKPSGDLLNDSKDDYKLFKIEYEAFNPTSLLITCDTYFDRNEFYTGDTIVINDYNILNSAVTLFVNNSTMIINLTQGSYTAAALGSHINTIFNTRVPSTFSISYNSSAQRFVFSGNKTFSLDFTSSESKLYTVLGFDNIVYNSVQTNEDPSYPFTITAPYEKNFGESTYIMSQHEAKILGEFINRSSGHEIVQTGCACDTGYYTSFYIRAPGTFDKKQGRFVVNNSIISCINNYNSGIDYRNVTSTNGYIMNFSLQNTIGISLDYYMNDANIIKPAPI